MRLKQRLVSIGLCMAMAACSSHNVHYDASKSHHRVDGFQNNYVAFQPKSLLEVARWRWNAIRNGLPKAPQAMPPVQSPDWAFLNQNTQLGAAMQPSVTVIGHSTVLVQTPDAHRGWNVLTDPVFSERASPVSFAGPKRAQPPAIALQDLPRIDVVFISHNHYDHLDKASVLALYARHRQTIHFVVPLGIGAWLRNVGVDADSVTELDWWQTWSPPDAPTGSVQLTLLPAQHWSARSLFDRSETLWGGVAVTSPDFHWVYTGDTGYSPDFADIAKYFAAQHAPQKGGGFDVALIPIGAYEPREFMRVQHVNPDDAVKLHLDLKPKRSIGVHWGTFALADEPLDQAPKDLAIAKAQHGVDAREFDVLAFGQTITLPRRGQRLEP